MRGQLHLEVARVLDRIPIDFGGGCSLQKACAMAWLIRRFRLGTTVDIGVYRGRSLFPQALAHRAGAGGVVYGVDPWSAREAVERDNEDLRDQIDEFVQTTDFEALHRDVVALNEELGLTEHCVLVRKTSSEAARWFEERQIRFDLVHVDGNHDTARVMEDLDLYLPKLNPGGFIVLDDISWKSVEPAYGYLKERMTLLTQRVDKANDYAIFRDGSPSLGTLWSKICLKAGFLR